MSLNFRKSGRFATVTGLGYKPLSPIPYGVNIDTTALEIPDFARVFINGIDGAEQAINKIPHQIIACLYAKSFRIALNISGGGSTFVVEDTLNVGTTLVVNEDGRSESGEPVTSIAGAFDRSRDTGALNSAFYYSVIQANAGLSLTLRFPIFSQGGFDGVGGSSSKGVTYYSLINKWNLAASVSGLITIRDEDDKLVDYFSLSSGPVSTDIDIFGTPYKLTSEASVTGSISVDEWLPMYPAP